jgi:DNA ligase-associated metallophosphoesterase
VSGFTTIRAGSTELELHPFPAAFWRPGRDLFVADLHLGKDAAFRASAIPVPCGPANKTLDRLATAIGRLRPERVWILGDLVHSVRSFTDPIREGFERFLSDHPTVDFSLVLGNHDRGIRDRLQGLRVDVLDPPYRRGEFLLVHDATAAVASAVPYGIGHHGDGPLVIGGHVHPAVTIAVGGEREKLPCFHQRGDRLTLPAMGAFTGTHRIEPQTDDEVHVVAEDSVIRISATRQRSRR